jgi:hypothetical protein
MTLPPSLSREDFFKQTYEALSKHSPGDLAPGGLFMESAWAFIQKADYHTRIGRWIKTLSPGDRCALKEMTRPLTLLRRLHTKNPVFDRISHQFGQGLQASRILILFYLAEDKAELNAGRYPAFSALPELGRILMSFLNISLYKDFGLQCSVNYDAMFLNDVMETDGTFPDPDSLCILSDLMENEPEEITKAIFADKGVPREWEGIAAIAVGNGARIVGVNSLSPDVPAQLMGVSEAFSELNKELDQISKDTGQPKSELDARVQQAAWVDAKADARFQSLLKQVWSPEPPHEGDSVH